MTDRSALENTARRWMQFWQGEGFALFDDVHALGFVDHSATNRLPTREGFRQGIEALYAAFPDFRAWISVLAIDTDAHLATIRWTAQGRHAGPFLGIAATNRTILFAGIEIIRIEKDRVVERWGEWDEGSILAQLQAGAVETPKLRVARPAEDLEAVTRFYREGLGLSVLYTFQDHDGFDGVMLGAANAPYHLEFTLANGHAAVRAPSEDNLLVFYLPETQDWQAAVQRMQNAGYTAVPAFNPYWDRNGRTFEDPDGYRVVLQNAAWNF